MYINTQELDINKILKTVIFNNPLDITPFDLNTSDLKSQITKSQDGKRIFEILANTPNFFKILEQLHKRGLMTYVSYLSDLKHCSPVADINFEPKVVNSLTANLKDHVRHIIETELVEPVYNEFFSTSLQQVKELHVSAVETTINNPFNLVFLDNKLVALLSYEEKKVARNFKCLVSTHWISHDVALENRKKIHAYYFNYLKDMKFNYYLASIFLHNKKSRDFFLKNKYTPFYAKVVVL